MLPFLTSYDPPGTSEGTLDPLGNNDTGSENTAIGAHALEDNTTGDLNTAIGNRDERLSKTS